MMATMDSYRVIEACRPFQPTLILSFFFEIYFKLTISAAVRK
jgi:hypothetical protein